MTQDKPKQNPGGFKPIFEPWNKITVTGGS